MAIEVRGATVFEDYATMLGPKSPGADSCWCISYRLRSAENNSLRKEARREKARELTTLDPPPGVLAYEGDEVVGWAAIHRRADTAFATNQRIPHVDDLDVWSLWCIRVRPGWRKRGIAHERDDLGDQRLPAAPHAQGAVSRAAPRLRRGARCR